MKKYESISTADLKAIYDFTKEDIATKKAINSNNSNQELGKQIRELEQVNTQIYDELLNRSLLKF